MTSLSLLALCILGHPAEAAIGYRAEVLAGVRCHVVRADLAQVRPRVLLAEPFPGAQDFGAIVRRERPVAAINGAYFDVGTSRPIGDLVVDGELRHSGRMGTALAITADGEARMFRVPWGRRVDWSGDDFVLACGPALVLGGQVDVDPTGERFRDPKVRMRTPRSGVGIGPEGRFMLIQTQTGVTLEEFARVFLAAGADHAMNLDAGASLAFYADGHTLRRPGRPLTNVLGLFPR